MVLHFLQKKCEFFCCKNVKFKYVQKKEPFRTETIAVKIITVVIKNHLI